MLQNSHVINNHEHVCISVYILLAFRDVSIYRLLKQKSDIWIMIQENDFVKRHFMRNLSCISEEACFKHLHDQGRTEAAIPTYSMYKTIFKTKHEQCTKITLFINPCIQSARNVALGRLHSIWNQKFSDAILEMAYSCNPTTLHYIFLFIKVCAFS